MTDIVPCPSPGPNSTLPRSLQVNAYLYIARGLRRISRVMNVLSDSEMDRIIPLLSEHHFSSREFLFSAGEVPDRVFLLLQGRVKLYQISDSGKEVIMDIAGPGDLVGEAAILEGTSHASYARSLEPTVVVSICWDDFVFLVQHSPKLALTMAEIMAGRLAYARRTLISLVAKPVSARLADALLERVDEGEIRLGLTHEDLGQTMGASRETVTALLSRFVMLGAIDPTPEGYRLANEELLRGIASGDVAVSPRRPVSPRSASTKS